MKCFELVYYGTYPGDEWEVMLFPKWNSLYLLSFGIFSVFFFRCCLSDRCEARKSPSRTRNGGSEVITIQIVHYRLYLFWIKLINLVTPSIFCYTTIYMNLFKSSLTLSSIGINLSRFSVDTVDISQWNTFRQARHLITQILFEPFQPVTIEAGWNRWSTKPTENDFSLKRTWRKPNQTEVADPSRTRPSILIITDRLWRRAHDYNAPGVRVSLIRCS